MANTAEITEKLSSVITRSKSQKTINDTVYTEQCELPTGKLPVQKDILFCMLYLLRPDRAVKAMRTLQEAGRRKW